MSPQKQTIQTSYYLNLALKYRWFIILPFCFSMLAGIYLALTLPKTYSAETMILVEPQRVPTNYVQSIVSTDIESRISTISQQIMSRTNIEKIIKEFNLFDGDDYENMYEEDKLELMRKRIGVKVTRARGADAFTVSFTGKDPQKVMQVANALATYFIDENLKVREAQATGTSDFLENEKSTMLKRLEELEKILQNYRTQYMGELPEQLDSNLNILGRLQEQLNQKEERLSDLRYRLTQSRNQTAFSASDTTNNASGETADLEQLKAQLTMLQAKYTGNHPDVVKTKSLIAHIEDKIKNQGLSGNENSGSNSNYSQSIQNQGLELEIRNLSSQINDIYKQIQSYQARVEVTPKREQELMSLTRDYNNILSSYNSLLNRKLEAEIAVNMEKKQKGEQFRIIDSAKLPEKPTSPDLKKLFVIFMFIGVGSGFGIIFVIDFLDTSFKSKEEVESFTSIPVLTMVPKIFQPETEKWHAIRNAFSLVSVFVSFGLFVIFAIITFKGVDQSMELASKIM
jgi:polysaccharide chain length determinant protein (PEP-CTERM system associated)